MNSKEYTCYTVQSVDVNYCPDEQYITVILSAWNVTRLIPIQIILRYQIVFLLVATFARDLHELLEDLDWLYQESVPPFPLFHAGFEVLPALWWCLSEKSDIPLRRPVTFKNQGIIYETRCY